jgi:hypothetical protein
MPALHGLTYNLNYPNGFKNKFELPHLSSNLNSLNHQKPDCFFGTLNQGKNPQHLAPDNREWPLIGAIRSIRRKISPARVGKNGKNGSSESPVKDSDRNSLRERLSPSQQAALQKVAGPSPRDVIESFIANLNSTESVSTLDQKRCQQTVRELTSTWIQEDKKKLEEEILDLFTKREWPTDVANYIIQPLK